MDIDEKQSPQFQSLQGFNQLVTDQNMLDIQFEKLYKISKERCFDNRKNRKYRSIRFLDTFLSDSFVFKIIDRIIENSKIKISDPGDDTKVIIADNYNVQILLLDPFSTFAKSRAYFLGLDTGAIKEINETLFKIRNSISIIRTKDPLPAESESKKTSSEFLFKQLKDIRSHNEFNLEIKFYELLTDTPIYLISQFVMKGLILYNRSSIINPWMIFVDDPTQDNDLFDYLSRNFDKIWENAKETPGSPEPQELSIVESKSSKFTDIKNVFISHGRNELVKLKIRDYVEKDLNLNPILFERDAEYGKGILENLENLTDKCSSAIIIITKEDEQKSGKVRGRQNVVHELGYCLAKYGKENVAVLVERGTEIPSNISGMLHVEFDTNNIESSFIKLANNIKQFAKKD